MLIIENMNLDNVTISGDTIRISGIDTKKSPKINRDDIEDAIIIEEICYPPKKNKSGKSKKLLGS